MVAFNGASWKDPDLITLFVMEYIIRDYSKNSDRAERTRYIVNYHYLL